MDRLENEHQILKDLGTRIKTLRKEKGMTQLDIASKSDIDVRLIQRLEAGKTNVKFITIYRIVQGFDMTFEEFFSFS